MTNAFGGIYVECGILQRRRSSRCLAVKSSFHISGNLMFCKMHDRRHGADPPKNALGNLVLSKGMTSRCVRVRNGFCITAANISNTKLGKPCNEIRHTRSLCLSTAMMFSATLHCGIPQCPVANISIGRVGQTCNVSFAGVPDAQIS